MARFFVVIPPFVSMRELVRYRGLATVGDMTGFHLRLALNMTRAQIVRGWTKALAIGGVGQVP